MLFNSFEFLLFFPAVILLYFLSPHRFRWALLLVASCLFYMVFKPVYILILIFTIVIDYFAGLLIEGAPPSRRRPYLVMSIVANVGVLCFFKYYNFLTGNFNFLFHAVGAGAHIPMLHMLLPIGLSFHTFQAMSYTIEVYRGNQKAERHFGIYALYVMFFPQLVAGPIERPQNMLHQFHEKHYFNWDNFVAGLQTMLWGFFKKIVVADRLAIIVNTVYKQPGRYTGVELCIATVFFAFQIYCDFSAYSDIALGSAQIMGYKLMVNFDLPFHSRSITEFWRRWHISLSTWFYDYVFNPVITALRHGGKLAIAFGLLLTFFLSGFWHGAGWKYIIYGLIHGVAMVYELYTRKFRKKLFKKIPEFLGKGISVVITFCYVAFSWIFFRASTVADAFYIIRHMGGGWGRIHSATAIKQLLTTLGEGDTIIGTFNVCAGLLLIVFLQYMERATGVAHPIVRINQMRPAAKWSMYYLLILSVLAVGVFNNQEFIYFQF